MQRNILWRWVPEALSLGLVVMLPSISLALNDAAGRLPAPRLLSPLGATIRQNDPDSGCPDHPIMGYGSRIEFEWEPVAGAEAYEIEARRALSKFPIVHKIVRDPFLDHRSCNSYVVDVNRTHWRWRVRTLEDRERAGPWSEWATFEYAPCRRAEGRSCERDPASRIAPAPDPPRGPAQMLRVVEERPAGLTAPEPGPPANGATLTAARHRELILSWVAVPGAAGYEVYVDCFQCCRPEEWCSEVNGLDSIVHPAKAPRYVFHWYGAQDWRWRVRAVDLRGRLGPMSEWRSFRYSP